MEPLHPKQAAFYLAATLPALEFEHATTKKILKALPVDRGISVRTRLPTARSTWRRTWRSPNSVS